MCSDFRRAESGTELLARLEGRSSLKELEPNLFADEDSPVHGDIFEFHGPEGTGKTEMLYHLTARCILPKSEGGLQIEVLFIDTDYHFDMLRLVTVLEHRLSQSSEEAMKLCLARLFLAYCSSSMQLLLTLHSLEALLCSRPSLCLLIVDSLSSFYWIDRVSGGESVALQESTLQKCSQLLERLVTEYRLLLFATTQSLMQKGSDSADGPSSSKHPCDGDMGYRAYLCKAWQRVVKHRVIFSRDDEAKSSRFSLVSRHLKIPLAEDQAPQLELFTDKMKSQPLPPTRLMLTSQSRKRSMVTKSRLLPCHSESKSKVSSEH